MNPAINAARWFNRVWPGPRLRGFVRKRAQRLVSTAGVSRVVEGVQGRFRMELDPAIDHEMLMYLHDYQQPALSLLRRLLRPGDTFVDGGANIGLFTLQAAACVGATGKVFAIEPMPPSAARIRRNLEVNAFNHVRVIDKALWDTPGSTTMYEFEGSPLSQASLGARQDKGAKRPHTVELVRLDDVVVGPVKLVKLDLEGAEKAALRGAERLLFTEPRPHVLIELSTGTCAGFGYKPIENLDWILAHNKPYRLHLLARGRLRRATRDAIAQRLASRPDRDVDVWLEPV